MNRFCHALIVFVVAAAVVHADEAFDNSEVAWQCRDLEHMIDLFVAGGRPRNLDPGYKVKVLVNHGYAVGYCEERRNPLWAVYVASDLSAGSDPERYERPQFFVRDLRVSPALDGRTFGGGFDRGHMVPNAVIGTQYGTLAQAETFFMSNMCPQKDDLNQGAWARLEKFVTEEVADKPLGEDSKRKHIYVIVGPIFGSEPAITERGPERGIQIPEAFFMILVDTDREFQDKPKVSILAHRFPQETARDADFSDRDLFGASINEIEAATRLDFFPAFAQLFDDWDAREEERAETHWKNN